MFKINEIESDIVNHSKVMLYDTLKLSALSKQSEANCCKTIVKKKGAFSAQCIYMRESYLRKIAFILKK